MNKNRLIPFLAALELVVGGCGDSDSDTPPIDQGGSSGGTTGESTEGLSDGATTGISTTGSSTTTGADSEVGSSTAAETTTSAETTHGDSSSGESSGDETTGGETTGRETTGDETTGDTTSGETGAMTGPPQLLSVTSVSPTEFELAFSEPMGAVDAVDPSRFRLVASVYEDYYSYTLYYSTDYLDGGSLSLSTALSSTADPSVLSLTIDAEIPATACTAPYFGSDLTFYMHYSATTGGTFGDEVLVDLDGEELAEIGGWFVDNPTDGYVSEDGNYPLLDPMVEVPICP